MIKYSSKVSKKLFKMEISLCSDNLNIVFENEIEDTDDILNKKFSTLLNNVDRLQKEGGSGLVKARKIVKYDLGCVENEVVVSAKEGKCIGSITINIEKLKRW